MCVYMHIYTFNYITTINEKLDMNLKENKKRYTEGLKGEKRKGK